MNLSGLSITSPICHLIHFFVLVFHCENLDILINLRLSKEVGNHTFSQIKEVIGLNSSGRTISLL